MQKEYMYRVIFTAAWLEKRPLLQLGGQSPLQPHCEQTALAHNFSHDTQGHIAREALPSVCFILIQCAPAN